MTQKEKIRELKRPKLKIMTHEAIGALYHVLPLCEEHEKLESYLDRLNTKEINALYQEVCQGVFTASSLGIEDQYGLNTPDIPEYEKQMEQEVEKFYKVQMKKLGIMK